MAARIWINMKQASLLFLFVILGLALSSHNLYAKRKVTADILKKDITKHIADISSDNIMTLKDDVTKEMLKLKFIKVHDPVRKMKNDVYFACTDFHLVKDKDKIYDIDFWLKDKGKGPLEVFRTKVHKHPVRGWVKKPRYTFRGEKIVPID